MVASRIRIIFQTACGQCLRRGIRAAGHTGIQPDPGFRQRHLSTAADPAADQGIRLGCLQETGQCAVTASVGIYNLFPDNGSVFHIIQFELFGVAKVLEDFSLFIRYCDSHVLASFHHQVFRRRNRCELAASADNLQPFPLNQRRGDFMPGAFIDCGYSGPCHIHLRGAGFLIQSFRIHQAQRLILVQRQTDHFSVRRIIRRKTAERRHLSDPPASDRSWHTDSSFIHGILPLMTYVNNNVRHEKTRCRPLT